MSNVFFSSAEIRWFLYNQQDEWDKMLSWFHEHESNDNSSFELGSIIKKESTRVDKYLLLPDCDTVGVKQRQGKLEVKAIVGGVRPFSLASFDVTGKVDQWIKWSFDSDHSEQLEAELDQAGSWRRIEKTRYLQKYSFDTGEIVSVTPDARPNSGCNIELTRLTVKANKWDWFTFGFEAYGPSGQVIAILNDAVTHYFEKTPNRKLSPIPLTMRDSLSYPAWLTTWV